MSWTDVAFVVALGLVVFGVAMVYVPASLIVGGVLVGALAAWYEAGSE